MIKAEPSLSYGQYDQRAGIGKYLTYAVVFGAIFGIGWIGYTHGKKLEKAAIGEVKSSSHVIIEQQQGQTTTITQENRQWLNNIVTEGK